MRFITLLAVPVFLAACDTAPDSGAVSSFNGKTVGIQGPGTTIAQQPNPVQRQLAADTCGGNAQYASTRMVSQYRLEFLFLCK